MVRSLRLEETKKTIIQAKPSENFTEKVLKLFFDHNLGSKASQKVIRPPCESSGLADLGVKRSGLGHLITQTRDASGVLVLVLHSDGHEGCVVTSLCHSWHE